MAEYKVEVPEGDGERAEVRVRAAFVAVKDDGTLEFRQHDYAQGVPVVAAFAHGRWLRFVEKGVEWEEDE